MKARHVARELAMLALFQMERHGRLPSVPDAETEAPSLHALIEDAVRALSDQAQDQIRTAVEALAIAADEIHRLEREHPDNLQTPLDAPAQPVPLPSTREVSAHLESALQAANMLGDALRLPELAVHAAAASVRDYAVLLIDATRRHAGELDALLEATSEDWKVSRMARMDRAILRLALAEMRFVEGVDISVSIDEAVRLAQAYAMPDSYRFINGVLGTLAQGDPSPPMLSAETPVHGDVGGHV